MEVSRPGPEETTYSNKRPGASSRDPREIDSPDSAKALVRYAEIEQLGKGHLGLNERKQC